MKKVLFSAGIFFSCLLSGKSAQAQYYFFDDTYYDQPIIYEGMGSVLAMNCLTDLGGKKGIGTKFIKDLNLGYTNVGGSVAFGIMYKNALGLRVEGTFGKVSSRDEILEGVTDIAKERYNRNLDFESRILEGTLLAEIHPLFIFVDWPAKDRPPPRYSPYFVGGIGYFSFNPQTRLGNRMIDLQPLRTEGQGFPEYPDRKIYKLNDINIPYGLGIKYELTPLINLRLEYLYRHLFTDYLDDLSTTYIDPNLFDKYLSPQKAQNARVLADRQREIHAGPGGKRGTATNNDGYFTLGLKVSVVIGRERMRR